MHLYLSVSTKYFFLPKMCDLGNYYKLESFYFSFSFLFLLLLNIFHLFLECSRGLIGYSVGKLQIFNDGIKYGINAHIEQLGTMACRLGFKSARPNNALKSHAPRISAVAVRGLHASRLLSQGMQVEILTTICFITICQQPQLAPRLWSLPLRIPH